MVYCTTAATACRMGCAISGSSSFGSCRGSGLWTWTSFAPLLGMSVHVDVPFTGSPNFFGAGIAISAFSLLFCLCLFLPARLVSSLSLDLRVVVICSTGIAVLCEPLVPYSLIEFWFSKFGRSCPSGSRKILHSVPPSATAMRSTSSPIHRFSYWRGAFRGAPQNVQV